MNNKRARRDTSGKFLPGTEPGPCRPKGSPDQATVNGKRVKADILQSWTEVNGPLLLRQLAAESPRDYLSLVLKSIGRELESCVYSDYPQEEMTLDQQKRNHQSWINKELFQVSKNEMAFRIAEIQNTASQAIQNFAQGILEDAMEGFHPELPFEKRLEYFRRLSQTERQDLVD